MELVSWLGYVEFGRDFSSAPHSILVHLHESAVKTSFMVPGYES
jgi:hypothetical protein